MKKIFLSLIATAFIFISCKYLNPSKNRYSQNLPYSVRAEQNLENVETVPLSRLGRKIEYVVLETNPDCVIRGIGNIEFTRSFIFISDFHRLLQFDRKGKFIRQIGSEGRGPEEYTRIGDICVSEEMERILVLSEKKMLTYDFDGKFTGSSNLSFISMNFLRVNNNLLFNIANLPVRTNDPVYSWIVTDMNSNTLFKLKNFHTRIHGSGGVGITPLFVYNGTPHFMEFGSDTLFFLKDTIPEPFALINLGSMKMDPDPESVKSKKDVDRLNEKLWTYLINEDQRYLFITFRWGYSDSMNYGVFNKQTHETTFLRDKAFINDLDGGMPFWPKYIYNDSILVDYTDAHLIIRAIDRQQLNSDSKIGKSISERFILLGEKLDENSNPVLIIIR